jgi:copper(I)-binding protein
MFHVRNGARRALIRYGSILPLFVFSSGRSTAADAQVFKLGSIRIDHPYSMPTRPGSRTAAVYFRTLINQGRAGDRLIGARAGVAGRVELHRMRIEDGVMRMREVDGIDLPPGQAVSFRHGQSDAFHLMLFDLKAPLKEGERFPVWLRFRDAGEVEVSSRVETTKGQAGAHSHHRH